MKRNYIIFFVFILIVCLTFFSRGDDNKNNSDYLAIEYTVRGEQIKLNSSLFPSSSNIKYFGNGIEKDINNDSTPDKIFLITEEKSSGEVYFYVVTALNKGNFYEGSKATFIGDRIAPQNISSGEGEGEIVVNYVTRNLGEDFSVTPSLGKSLYLKFNSNSRDFGEVVKDFEGEANPDIMKVTMKVWKWEGIFYGDGRKILPKNDKFSLELKENNTFFAQTDCNNISGEYKVLGSQILFDKMISTLMYCDDSQELHFSKALSMAESFKFTSKGEFIINLKSNSGYILFK